MDILYLASLDDTELSEKNIEDVSARAISYDNFYVYSRDKVVCEEFKSNALNSHGIDINAIWISPEFPIREVGAVLGFLFGFSKVQIDVLDSLDETYIEYIDAYITEGDVENCYKLIRKYSERTLVMTGVTPVFQLRLLRAISSLVRLCEIDKRLMTGDSFLIDTDVYLRGNDTDYECLKLKELIAAEAEYLALFSSEIGFSSNLRSKKNTFLAMFKSVVPSTPTSLPRTGGYPSCYKVLSAYFYFCSEVKVMKESINSAFLYAFRALEAYCDGILITLDLAKIGNCFYPNGDLKKENAFLLTRNNSPVMGFGGKWKLVKEQDVVVNTISQILIGKINLALQFRNKFNLTHGDVKIKGSVLFEMQSDIKSFITQVDTALLQQGFEWDTLKSQFCDFVTYDCLEELRYLVRHSFPCEEVT